MAKSIQTAINLYDGVTAPLQSMHRAMEIVLNSFEAMQQASGNAVDVSSIQQARDELAKAGTAFDNIEQEIQQADQAEQQFNQHIQEASVAADGLGDKLKGILATVGSIATIKMGLGWAKENMDLADIQRNAENQLAAVLKNMGATSVEVPVSAPDLSQYTETLTALDGREVVSTATLDTENAVSALNNYDEALNQVNGADAFEQLNQSVQPFDGDLSLTMDAGAAVETYNGFVNQVDQTGLENTLNLDTKGATTAYSKLTGKVDGAELSNTLTLYTVADTALIGQVTGMDLQNTVSLTVEGVDSYDALVDQVEGTKLENTLNLDTAEATADYNDFVNTASNITITATVQVDTTKTISAFEAITQKASEIQSRGIYGDEAMIAGAAELATYFSDTQAIMAMMDTLSNYAMGMTGGGALDASAMTQYATDIGKIMTGSYGAMTKKGFEFTDAQKAVIDGTATEAQYVEALGAEYLSMSEDMRAATVINDIISESWGGLYEAMSNTPQGKIIQFNNTLGDLRETMGNQVYPAVLMFFDVFQERFPEIEMIMSGITQALAVLIEVLTWIAELALNVASAIIDNWSWIGPIVWGVIAALTVYAGYLAITHGLELASAAAKGIMAVWEGIHAAAIWATTSATWAEVTAQLGLNGAMYACPIVWIIGLVIALIAAFYAAVGAVNKLAGTTVSATGIIGGVIGVLVAFVGNIFVTLINFLIDIFVVLWNFIASFANFFGNVFNDPIGSIARLFFDLVDTVLSLLQSLASAIDTIFGSNLAGAVSGWRDSLSGWVDSTFGQGEEIMAKVNAQDFHLERFQYTEFAKAGYEIGKGIEDSVSGLFDIPTLEDMGYNPPGMDAYNVGNTLDGINNNTGNTAGNTADMKDALDITDEDLAYLRDIAEREAINRYTTAEIKVEQQNTNYIEKDADLDGIMDSWATDFAQRLEISGEGVHV